jgi:hypothetical protein
VAAVNTKFVTNTQHDNTASSAVADQTLYMVIIIQQLYLLHLLYINHNVHIQLQCTDATTPVNTATTLTTDQYIW